MPHPDKRPPFKALCDDVAKLLAVYVIPNVPKKEDAELRALITAIMTNLRSAEVREKLYQEGVIRRKLQCVINALKEHPDDMLGSAGGGTPHSSQWLILPAMVADLEQLAKGLPECVTGTLEELEVSADPIVAGLERDPDGDATRVAAIVSYISGLDTQSHGTQLYHLMERIAADVKDLANGVDAKPDLLKWCVKYAIEYDTSVLRAFNNKPAKKPGPQGYEAGEADEEATAL